MHTKIQTNWDKPASQGQRSFSNHVLGGPLFENHGIPHISCWRDSHTHTHTHTRKIIFGGSTVAVKMNLFLILDKT